MDVTEGLRLAMQTDNLITRSGVDFVCPACGTLVYRISEGDARMDFSTGLQLMKDKLKNCVACGRELKFGLMFTRPRAQQIMKERFGQRQ